MLLQSFLNGGKTMYKSKIKQALSFFLTLVMFVQMISVSSIMAGAVSASDEPDVVYEESFNSGLWAIEPKTSLTNFASYNPTAPTVTDGKLSLIEGNSAAFYWSKIPGVAKTGTYTLSFDVDVTDNGNNKSLISESVWKRELNVLLGGGYDAAQFRSCHTTAKKLMMSGSGVSESNYGSDTYSVKIVWDTTVSPNTITTTVTKGDEINATKTKSVDDTTETYAECRPFWAFRCEDGAVEITNFTFTDGALSISGFEEIGESFLTTEGDGIWTVEQTPPSSSNYGYNYTPTAPIGYNGKLYMKKGDSVSLWWDNIPNVESKGIYRISFNVDITDFGNNKSLITESTWTRELNMTFGGTTGVAQFRSSDGAILASGKKLVDSNYGTGTYSVTMTWNNTTASDSIYTSIKNAENGYSRAYTRTVDPTGASYEECSKFWVFRCEDGKVEISNFKFTAINAFELVASSDLSVPEGQETIYDCDLSFNGDATAVMMGDYELLTIKESGMSMLGGANKGSYGHGTYHINARVNPSQKMLLCSVTLPEGGTIRRGMRIDETVRDFTVGIYGVNSVSKESISYADVTLNEYTLLSEEPVYEGFDANVYNLVTSFTDARYDRAFAWTALESFIGEGAMAIKYRAVGESAWSVVDAIKEEESLSDTEAYFKADVTELKASTRYEYKVGIKNSTNEETDWSKSYFFTTAKENVDDFSFIAFGDNQAYTWGGTDSSPKAYMYSQVAITQALKETAPAMILNTGDITETNAPAEYGMYFKSLGGIVTQIPHFATIGGGVHDKHDFFDMYFNHPNNGGDAAYTDTTAILDATPIGAEIVNYLDETVYSFNYGDVHFVVVDSGATGRYNVKALMQQQRAWLKADLQANQDAKWTILMTHRPAYHMSGANNNNEWLVDIIEEYGVDLVLSGHMHHVTRTYPMKNRQIVTKENPDVIQKGIGTVYTTIGSCAPNHDGIAELNEENMMTIISPDRYQPAYTVIDVEGNNLVVTIRQADGLVLDSFTITGDVEEPAEDLKLTGASVNLGADLAINYYVNVVNPAILDNGDLAIRFTMNGQTTTVTDYKVVNGEYVFTFGGIAPQQMADLIDAEVLVGDTVYATQEDYSIKQNCLNLLSKSAAQLGLSDAQYAAMQTLIADLLSYGQASQNYKDYAGNGAILDGTEEIVPSTVTPVASDAMTLTGNTDASLHFSSATVRFDTVNSIVIRIFADVEDFSLVTVKVNGTSYALSDLIHLGNGTYKLSTNGISAVNFDTVYTVELLYDGTSVASISYSVNAYAYAMCNGATQNEEMQALAKVLYRYGVSAKAYRNAQ